jgi:hypothetical protein
MRIAGRWGLGACVALALPAAGCGQKGPPLAPLHLVPAAVTELSARRVGDRVRLRFVLPARNANGPGPVALDRVEIFAMTVAPGAPPPPNRELMSKPYLVGQLEVRPVPVEGEQPKEGDTRPEPGAVVTFDEELDAARLTPVPMKITKPAAAAKSPAESPPAAAPEAAAVQPSQPAGAAPAPGAGPPAATGSAQAPGAAPQPTGTAPPAAGTAPAAAAGGVAPVAPLPAAPDSAGIPPVPALPGAQQPEGIAPVPPLSGAPQAARIAPVPTPAEPRRIYIARGVTRSGRPGAPSPRVQMALAPLPSAPVGVAARFTESAVFIEWKPPAEASAASYNIYRADDPMQPVNTAPVTAAPFEDGRATFGKPQCYRVRSVARAADATIEGEPSEEACVTPMDVFAPAAPAGLAAVSTPGQISLIWDANTEKDLAGYIVLRADASGGDLRPITPSPIRETSFRDATVTPGTRYVYAIVAVDRADPPNTSAPSARVEETAR